MYAIFTIKEGVNVPKSKKNPKGAGPKHQYSEPLNNRVMIRLTDSQLVMYRNMGGINWLRGTLEIYKELVVPQKEFFDTRINQLTGDVVGLE